MKKNLMVLLVLVLGPVVVFAQGTIGSVLAQILGLLNMVVPILIVLAIIYFIWGVIRYVVSGDEETKKKARDMIIYGIIGLAVIVGMWGLVGMLLRSFDVTGGAIVTPPPVVQPVLPVY